jgi:hypothetical protein
LPKVVNSPLNNPPNYLAGAEAFIIDLVKLLKAVTPSLPKAYMPILIYSILVPEYFKD